MNSDFTHLTASSFVNFTIHDIMTASRISLKACDGLAIVSCVVRRSRSNFDNIVTTRWSPAVSLLFMDGPCCSISAWQWKSGRNRTHGIRNMAVSPSPLTVGVSSSKLGSSCSWYWTDVSASSSDEGDDAFSSPDSSSSSWRNRAKAVAAVNRRGRVLSITKKTNSRSDRFGKLFNFQILTIA